MKVLFYEDCMNKYGAIKDLSDEKFKRLTGVSRKTFDKMIEILQVQYKLDRAKCGRHRTVSIEDSLLMTLEYLREYRTYFHVSQSYGLTESWAYRVIIWVENTLIKSTQTQGIA